MSTSTPKIAIIGAGLAGSLLSIFLVKRGFTVDIYEKRRDPRLDDRTRGRSIAMSISHRGLSALKRIGLDQIVLCDTVAKHSRMVHLENGQRYVQAYGHDDDAIHTVSRRQLNIQLIQTAEETGRVRFFFQHECMDLHLENGRLELEDVANRSFQEKDYDHIIGADGIFSQMSQMMVRKHEAEFTHLTLAHGYKELTIPPAANGDWALPIGYVHVWPRPDCVFLALPVPDKSFTCTLFFPMEGTPSFESIQTEADVVGLFEHYFPELLPLIPNLTISFFENPTSNIITVSGRPWHYDCRLMLIGDACHAIAPFYAMGMNVCFEDCAVFDDLLSEFDNDLSRAIPKFESRRKPDTDAIAELSLRNFQNIRHSVEPDFHHKWEIERKLWEIAPDKWAPIYAQIAFSSVPLSQVIASKPRQAAVIERILAENIAPDSLTPDRVQSYLDAL